MVVRMWYGRVPLSKAQAYKDFLNQKAIPDYQAIPGNLSVHLLERQEGDVGRIALSNDHWFVKVRTFVGVWWACLRAATRTYPSVFIRASVVDAQP